LLGRLRIERDAAELPLPPSRKVAALLGYLAMAVRPVPRDKLCDTFWDSANDPRGELRWCLSKIRGLLDTPHHKSLLADRDWVGIDRGAIAVDAWDLAHSAGEILGGQDCDALRAIVVATEGEFLEGLALEGAPIFTTWRDGERHRFANILMRALERLAGLLPQGEEKLGILRQCLMASPFETAWHLALVDSLLAAGHRDEAERHVEAAGKLFERERLDARPLLAAWTRLSAGRSGIVLSDGMAASSKPTEQTPAGRALLAVLPFEVDLAATQVGADGMTTDVISGLAKLRSLRVVARGSVTALRDKGLGPRETAAALSADYIVTGKVRQAGRSLRVAIELVKTDGADVVWSDALEASIDPGGSPCPLTVRIIAAIEAQVVSAERNRALLKPVGSLGAWETYHRGLWHMYRFDQGQNASASNCFERAVTMDPTFARAWAGLSFTHFQDAFQFRLSERQRRIDLAIEAAGNGLMADPQDPAVHCAMGRALWLRRDDIAAFDALEHSVRLSPSYAMGHYAIAFVHSQSGDPERALVAASSAQELSPYDPLLFGILAARSFSLQRLDRPQDAAAAARLAATQPNAHAHVHGIAALAAAVAGDLDRARSELGRARDKRHGYNLELFLSAFRLHPDLERLYRKAGERLGLN
jgi:DNA-binding SARP family transcriptional activator/Tfp pilus assembly protein PilF